MSTAKIILIVTTCLFFLIVSISALRMNKTVTTTENHINVTKPFGKKEKLYAIVGSAIVAFLVIRQIVLW